MEEYKSVQKYLKRNKQDIKTKSNFIYTTLSHILLSGILLLTILCIMKTNTTFKDWVKKNVYQTNISFAKINKTYEKYFGSIFPKLDFTTATVFNEQLTYSKKEDYREGVKLTVTSNYLVPIIESGIVVFIGNKDNYGNVIIIQQVNGIDVWYVGVENSNIKIYDYVEKGSLLGEAISNEIYLYYQKEGKFLDYKKYL